MYILLKIFDAILFCDNLQNQSRKGIYDKGTYPCNNSNYFPADYAGLRKQVIIIRWFKNPSPVY